MMVQIIVQLNDGQEWAIALTNEQFLSMTVNINQTQIEKDVCVDFLSIDVYRQKLFLCPMKEVKTMRTLVVAEEKPKRSELYKVFINKEGTK